MSETPAAIPLRFFQALQQKDYILVWNSLSQYSQNMIVGILSQSWKEQTADEIRLSFEKGQSVARTYWDAFRNSIRLEEWLNQSYRSFGVSGNEVIVKATPSDLTMMVYREGTNWKFGYLETFLEK